MNRRGDAVKELARVGLLDEIHRFLGKSGMSQSRFGALAMRDHKIVTHLRNGREPRAKTIRKLYGFMLEWESQQK